MPREPIAMGAADDIRRGATTGTASACSCCNDEASGAHALRLGQQQARPGYNALFQEQPDFSFHPLPSHDLPPPHHYQQLPLLGKPSSHQALASSARSIAPDSDLGSGSGKDSRPAPSRIQPFAHNSSLPPIPDGDGPRAAFGICSSSKPTLAFAVIQQYEADSFSALNNPSALTDCRFDDTADTSCATQLAPVTFSGHSQIDHFPPTQELTRMAVANAVAPPGLSSDSFYARHLSGHLPTMHTNTDLPILNAHEYEIMGSSGTSKSNVTQEAGRTNKKTPATGKRSRPTDDADGAGEEEGDLDEDEGRRKRSRGRPRLDTKDETAADVSEPCAKVRPSSVSNTVPASSHSDSARAKGIP